MGLRAHSVRSWRLAAAAAAWPPQPRWQGQLDAQGDQEAAPAGRIHQLPLGALALRGKVSLEVLVAAVLPTAAAAAAALGVLGSQDRLPLAALAVLAELHLMRLPLGFHSSQRAAGARQLILQAPQAEREAEAHWPQI